MKEKYQKTESFYFEDDHKCKYTEAIKSVVCENNEDGSFKRRVAYCITEEDAEKICEALNDTI